MVVLRFTMKNTTPAETYVPTNDDGNPAYLFSTTPTDLLVAALDGRVDLVAYARREMVARGCNEQGQWVGFGKAK
jgi:hypothetical protein